MGNLPENSRAGERRGLQRRNPCTLFSSKGEGKYISCKIFLRHGGAF